MLTVEAALARVLAYVPPVGIEILPLAAAAGRVLAEPVTAACDLPPWDNSAMDGYAARAADTPGTLPVTARTLAGDAPATLAPGAAVRIMTGAPMPAGADTVIMQEDARRVPPDPGSPGDLDRVTLPAAPPGQHLRRRGADAAAGTTLLSPGQILTPGALALCAALGRAQVAVALPPRVAILSTGSELRPPGEPLSPGQIWSSNEYALAALVAQAGALPVTLGITPDDPAATRDAFARALRCDVVLSTGGVSVGEHDFVKDALADLGLTLSAREDDPGGGFWKVWMKPGKPLMFGVLQGRPIFGLPGNPVSCMVNFFQFVRPLLRRMLGDPEPFLPVLRAALDRPHRRRPDRPELIRVRLHVHDGLIRASVIGHQGSGNLAGMARAHGFLLAPADATELSGEVHVQVFDPSFLSAPAARYPWADAAPDSLPDGSPSKCC